MTRAITYRSIAIIGGLILALMMITSTSRAVWTDTTDTVGIVGSGDVILTDDDFATSTFAATNMKPGETRTGCIAVSYSGSLSASVDLTSITVGALTSPVPHDLPPVVDLRIERFANNNCSGAAAGTLTAPTDTLQTYWGGTTPVAVPSPWTPTGGVTTTESYLVTVTVQLSAPNAAQGEDAEITLLWTASNT